MTLRKRNVGRKRARILVVDDHPAICEGIKTIVDLEGDMAVCGCAASAAEALPAISRAKPDVVLLDISLPDGDGMDVLRDIVKTHAGLPVVMYSVHADSGLAERALRLGAKGYITKSESAAAVPMGLRTALAGGIYVSPKLNEGILKNLGNAGGSAGQGESGASLPARLTGQQKKVFELIVKGMTTKEIGEALGLNSKTVDKHRRNIMAKFGVKTIAGLIKLAIKAGLVCV
jgi:DNA-binding NarL/FixJ family response regulator